VQKAVRFVANTIGVNVYELKTRLEHLAHKFAAVSA
jgi:hypothetical protein